ncbi:MAG: aminotransferase class I/II-fold pyridoxal phosphate-dependent enzyme [Vicinamibacterales bacterium]|nr:aminotransferase class I/II-fold pyridoxal phosphate-dependent enzyme [Vicinamibacterales bacterium]
MTAVAGVVGGATAVRPAAAGASVQRPTNGRYDFDTPLNRIGTMSVKYDQQITKYGKDSISVGMGVADMDFRVPPAITNALAKRIEHECWGYLDMPPAFADSIVAWNKRRYNQTIDPALLQISSGVYPGLIAAMQTFCPPGSKVILQTPTYNGFYGMLDFAKVTREESPMKIVNGRYTFDFEDLERRITHETHALILCNPQNPTGNVWTEAELTRLGEICLRRRVIVLSDEIHCDFVTKGQAYVPFGNLPDKDIVRNSMTFKAASKSFGLAAHKVGWFFSDNPEFMARVRANHRADISTLGVVANHAALTEGGEWLDQLVEYLDANHDFTLDFISTKMPSIKAYKPESTYLSWIDVTEVAERIGAARLAAEANRTKAPGAADLTPEQMVERFFVREARVQLNQGASYGPGGANHMRMNLGTSRQMLEEGLTNMANAVRRL